MNDQATPYGVTTQVVLRGNVGVAPLWRSDDLPAQVVKQVNWAVRPTGKAALLQLVELTGVVRVADAWSKLGESDIPSGFKVPSYDFLIWETTNGTLDLLIRDDHGQVRTAISDVSIDDLDPSEGVVRLAQPIIDTILRLPITPKTPESPHLTVEQLAEQAEILLAIVDQALQRENSRLRRELESAYLTIDAMEAQLRASQWWVRTGAALRNPKIIKIGLATLTAPLVTAAPWIVSGAISGGADGFVSTAMSDDPGIEDFAREACALAGDEITITINQDNDTTIIDGGTP